MLAKINDMSIETRKEGTYFLVTVTHDDGRVFENTVKFAREADAIGAGVHYCMSKIVKVVVEHEDDGLTVTVTGKDGS